MHSARHASAGTWLFSMVWGRWTGLKHTRVAVDAAGRTCAPRTAGRGGRLAGANNEVLYQIELFAMRFSPPSLVACPGRQGARPDHEECHQWGSQTAGGALTRVICDMSVCKRNAAPHLRGW